MQKTTTWRKNFRRWSVQAASLGALLGAVELAGHIAVAVQPTLPLWRPFLPPMAYAAVATGLSVLTVIVRNIPQPRQGRRYEHATVDSQGRGRAPGLLDGLGDQTKGPERSGQGGGFSGREGGTEDRGGAESAPRGGGSGSGDSGAGS